MSVASLDMTSSLLAGGQGPFLSARRVADTLGVTLSELAGLIGVAATR